MLACLCTKCMAGIDRGQKGHWIPWDWSVRWFVRPHVSAGNQAQVLWKSS